MTLRSSPVEHQATLPDGRVVRVRVAIAEDSYIKPRDLDTVVLELIAADGMHLAGVSTVLGAHDDSAARALVQEVVVGLESGSLEPTAGAIEPLADRLAPE